MAQKSGFFNALLVDGQYDRKYNADDYSENLAVVISNGVLRSTNDDLKVTSNGLVVSVGVGHGWINGKYYHNTSEYTFDAISPPTGGNRYDRIVLRLDNTVATRTIYLAYLQGTAATTPTKPALTRNSDVYELCLADLYITANASGMTVTDTRDDPELCGWVYSTSGDDSFFTSLDNSFNAWFQSVRNTLSSVTLFKRYSDEITLAQSASIVSFNIPQYDQDTCFIEVYINGILETNYTLSGSVVTFASTLNAGTVVTVNCYKSIDGTGIMDVSEEITELQNQFATLSGVSDYVYKCTGANDNISLSEIAQAIISGSYTVGSLSTAAESFLTALGGNTFLAALPTDAQITVDVVGKLGATSPYSGSGTSVSRYQWFSLGAAATNAKRIVFDFAKCERISVACAANSKNTVFYGSDLNIRNANVRATGASANTDIIACLGAINEGHICCENCRFTVETTGFAAIAETGTFCDCDMTVVSSAANAICIDAKSPSFVRLNGGTYYAYTGTTSFPSAIIRVLATETDAVVSAVNISAPTRAKSGHYQNVLCLALSGTTQMIGTTTLLQNSSDTYVNMVNTIASSKE